MSRRTKSIAGWVATALVVGVWFVSFRPPVLGGPATSVAVSGQSMHPTFDDGDLAIVHRRDRYETGDVVAFRIPAGDLAAGARVLHRIVGGNATDGYVTRGDNNDYNDKWRPTSADIIGEKWLHIPAGASTLAHLREPIVLASLAAVAGFLVVVTWTPRRARRPESLPEPAAAVPIRRAMPDATLTCGTVALTAAAVLLRRHARR